MPIETLQKLGFSVNEAKIYKALLALKEASVGQISSKTRIHRRNIYDTLKRLEDKGLIFPILEKGENRYTPADPEILNEFLKQEENSLKKILPEMEKRYIKRQDVEEAYIYRGVEGFKNYMRDILRVGKEAYFIGAKFGWFDPRLKAFTEDFMRKAKQKGIKFYHVFDQEVQEKAPKSILKSLGKDYRFLPQKYATDSAIDIFGDYVVTFTGIRYKKIADDVRLFVMRGQRLAASYKLWFQFLYDYCPKK